VKGIPSAVTARFAPGVKDQERDRRMLGMCRVVLGPFS
jgi:hypothetical protein